MANLKNRISIIKIQMCLPLSCLKTFLGIGTGITILLSLVSLGFGIYLLYFSNQLDTKGIWNF